MLTATATAADAPDGLALDGKTLRGSRKQGAPGAQLLSAVSHRLGMTTGQVAARDTTNAIGTVAGLLRGLVLEGRVFTMDALLTQRQVAQAITDGGGDYVMVAFGNHPQLHADLATGFATPPPAATDRGPR